MSRKSFALRRPIAVLGIAMALAGPAWAAPGDTYKVTGEKVNLRSAPSDQASIRSTVTEGDQVIALREEGKWLGVRVLKSGEEGWIFSDLARREAQSTLGGPAATTAAQTGLGRFSPGFDRLVGRIGDQLGYGMVDRIEQGPNNTLHVTPTQEWLYNTSRDAKLYAALALYEMWKNYNNGRPVNLALGGAGADALTIGDTGNGPELGLPQVGASR